MGASIEQTPETLEAAARRWQRFNRTGRKVDADRLAEQIITALESMIIKHSSPFIHATRGGRTKEEMLQRGRIAVFEALARYQPHLREGASFSTFAFNAIRFQILKYVGREENLSDVYEPAHAVYEREKVRRIQEAIPDATPEQIADVTGLKVKQVLTVQRTAQAVRPAARYGTQEGDTINPELNSAFAFDWTAGTVDQITIEQLLTRLSEQDQEILRRRFFDRETLREIAESLGLCKERIRQLEAAAICKLRKMLAQ